jgi:hypothetical protein
MTQARQASPELLAQPVAALGKTCFFGFAYVEIQRHVQISQRCLRLPLLAEPVKCDLCLSGLAAAGVLHADL